MNNVDEDVGPFATLSAARAFGCVVWAMLTGRAAFAGETVSDTMPTFSTGSRRGTRSPRISPSPFSGCCDAASKEIRGAAPAMSAMRRSSLTTSFPLRYAGELAARNNYMPAADGKRFLINTSSNRLPREGADAVGVPARGRRMEAVHPRKDFLPLEAGGAATTSTPTATSTSSLAPTRRATSSGGGRILPHNSTPMSRGAVTSSRMPAPTSTTISCSWISRERAGRS